MNITQFPCLAFLLLQTGNYTGANPTPKATG